MSVVDAEKKYYGKEYDFVVNERKALDEMFKKDFKKKYPYVDMSRFYFEHDINKDGSWNKTITYFKNNAYISTNITSDTFKSDPEMTKYLYINKPHFPRIWKLGGSMQPLLRGKRHVGYAGKGYYWDNFPTEYILNYPIQQFRIYVNNTDYFQSNLPALGITTNDNARWTLNEPYFQCIIGTWIATYGCGVSIQHLSFSSDVPKQITSLMRFHLYFTVRRIMWQLRNGDYKTYRKFDASFLQYHYPKWTWQEISGKKRHIGDSHAVDMSTPWPGYKHGPGQLRDTQNDYRKFVPSASDGLTKKGTELLNASIEAYLYSILGAQARTRQSIVSNRASSLETQKVFRKIVEDSIVNYDTTTWINNMNVAVSATNVVLNTAISSTLWLIPSSMIILKNPIEGYNNRLKVSSEDMTFGINENLNYYGDKKETLQQEKKYSESMQNKDMKTSNENLIIFSLSLLGGILISRNI